MGVERGYKSISIAEYFTFPLELQHLAWGSVIINYSMPDITPSVYHFLKFSAPIRWMWFVVTSNSHGHSTPETIFLHFVLEVRRGNTKVWSTHIMHNDVSRNIFIAVLDPGYIIYVPQMSCHLRWWEWTSRHTPNIAHNYPSPPPPRPRPWTICIVIHVWIQLFVAATTRVVDDHQHHRADHIYPCHWNMTHHWTCQRHTCRYRPQLPLHQGLGARSCISGWHDCDCGNTDISGTGLCDAAPFRLAASDKTKNADRSAIASLINVGSPQLESYICSLNYQRSQNCEAMLTVSRLRYPTRCKPTSSA